MGEAADRGVHTGPGPRPRRQGWAASRSIGLRGGSELGTAQRSRTDLMPEAPGFRVRTPGRALWGPTWGRSPPAFAVRTNTRPPRSLPPPQSSGDTGRTETLKSHAPTRPAQGGGRAHTARRPHTQGSAGRAGKSGGPVRVEEQAAEPDKDLQREAERKRQEAVEGWKVGSPSGTAETDRAQDTEKGLGAGGLTGWGAEPAPKETWVSLRPPLTDTRTHTATARPGQGSFLPFSFFVSATGTGGYLQDSTVPGISLLLE